MAVRKTKKAGDPAQTATSKTAVKEEALRTEPAVTPEEVEAEKPAEAEKTVGTEKAPEAEKPAVTEKAPEAETAAERETAPETEKPVKAAKKTRAAKAEKAARPARKAKTEKAAKPAKAAKAEKADKPAGTEEKRRIFRKKMVKEQPEGPVLPQPRRSIAFIGSECYPFVKTGGLGDVMYALPKALIAQNCDVKVILPRYKCIPQKYQDKMVYRGSFEMNLCEDGRSFYVGIMEYVWDGVVYDFIDNEEFFSSGNPYTCGRCSRERRSDAQR